MIRIWSLRLQVDLGSFGEITCPPPSPEPSTFREPILGFATWFGVFELCGFLVRGAPKPQTLNVKP